MHPPHSHPDLDADVIRAVSAQPWEVLRAALARLLRDDVDDNDFVEDELIAE
jgi:hypothetical protein